jgi:hypothetical protein
MKLALILGATLLPAAAGEAMAQSKQLVVELNKLEPIANGCRTFFLFRNRTATPFTGFELSLAVLDQKGVIDRLLTVDAAPLPAERTTLKLFEIPQTNCDAIGEILLHEIARCEMATGPVPNCFALVDLQSKGSAALTK